MIVKRILFVVNCPAFFISHRLPVALAARRQGYEVHVATMPGDEVDQICAVGLTHHELPLTRSGVNPLNELFVFTAIYKLFRQLKPELVHLVTIKPVLYGGFAARLARVPGVVAAVSGLGFVFIAKGFKASLIRVGVMNLYRLAFGKRNLRVIFQNPNDRNSFIEAGALTADKAMLIRGSGVNLADYPATIEPEGSPVIIMASRLLRDKGVLEYVQAARLIKQQGVDAKFILVGGPDVHNPATVTDEQLKEIKNNGDVELLGFQEDIPALLAASNIVVLPSYREGLPKVLVEAAAAGRAVVTSDVPGCRDAIEVGVSGLLVPPRNPEALAKGIQILINDPELRKKMAEQGRYLAEREFDLNKIVKAHLEIYRALEVGR
jgi:glycosyltransferase involved in cell wall biosynthesis